MTIDEGNPLRAAMVRDAIEKNASEPPTVKNLAQYLPEDFALGPDDLERYAAQVEADLTPTPQQSEKVARLQNRTGTETIEFEPGPEIEQAAENGSPPEATSAEVKPASGTPAEIEAATARRLEADKIVANARVAVLVAQNAEREARKKLATAVQTFQSGFAPVTADELKRQFVKEQSEIRRAIAAGEMAPPRRAGGVGKSVVDRLASYGRGGSPAAGNYRRGAFPASAQGGRNYDPRRGAVAKLPFGR